MKNQLSLLLLITFLCSYKISAQQSNWRDAPLKKDANYFNILKSNEQRISAAKRSSNKVSKKQIKQFNRWKNFWKDRILPDGSFVSATHNYNELKKENKRHARLRKKQSTSWSIVGPLTPPKSSIGFYPGMGRVNTVAFKGTDTNTMYVGTPGGGVWKTTDGGKNWAAKGDNFPNLGVSHIVIHPTDSKILYLATGDYDGGQNRSVGVFKSVDSGENWNATGLSFSLNQNNIISKLLIDPNNPNTIFATTKNSIKRSTDGGTNWTDVFTENFSSFNDIQYKTGSSTIIYATTKYGSLYISRNNGATWSVASKPSSSRLDIAQTTNDPNLILSLDSSGIVRKSTDEGKTWTTVSTISGYSAQGGYNMTLAISPLDKNLILAGGVEGWRSKNGGTSWEKYLDGYWETGNPYFYVHSDHHDMMFVPGTNTAFSVNDGGIFKGDASSDTKWADLSSGLAITQYYNVSGTPKDQGKLILGAQDNDIAIYDGSNGFKGENPGSDGVEGLWDYSDSNIAWSCSQQGGMNRTLDGFKTAATRVSTPSGAPFVWELEIHPTDPKTIFGGFGDIYKSTDRGNNWINLNSSAGTIEFISIAPSNANIIYVSGQSGVVRKTTNGGTTWTSITLPQRGNVKSIEVHPTNPSEVYIAYSGYSVNKVFRSTNGGTSWTNITGALPNIPTHKIIYRTGSSDGELFLATDLGVYYRTNSKGDWVRLGSGLPNVIVHDIEIHYATNKLRAATYGRGVWEASISSSALGTEDNKLPKTAISLFPNPTNSKNINIKLNKLTGKTNILIYNIIGSVVKDLTIENTEKNINLSGFSNGIYLVKITNNNKSITKKLIVK
ncbi:T9SS type A sorting domain-containing protein [Tenacibaculum halocynthiae]|uniref:T9SS type A sorting domain-containing protein n=1 Tax=Tenacibaculum halocynthiae TaxID=1254437 RepID=UPI003893DDDE